MKFLIMTKYDPPLSPHFRQPFIVWGRLFETELVFWVVMKFDGKRRRRFPKCLWKALAEASIKIECQCTRDLAFLFLEPTPSKSRAIRTCSFSSPKSSAMSMSLSPAFHRPLMIQVGMPPIVG